MESNKENIIRECIKLLSLTEKVKLYELFNGGTYDEESFNGWIVEFI